MGLPMQHTVVQGYVFPCKVKDSLANSGAKGATESCVFYSRQVSFSNIYRLIKEDGIFIFHSLSHIIFVSGDQRNVVERAVGTALCDIAIALLQNHAQSEKATVLVFYFRYKIFQSN